MKSKLNEIKLWEMGKYGTHISYNINESLSDNLKVETENIYDIIIELFYRKEQGKKLTPKLGMLLTIEEWIKEEGKFAKKQLETLRRDLQSEQIEFRNLGRNRY